MIGSSLVFVLTFALIGVVIEYFLGFFAPHAVFESENRCKICYYIGSNFYFAFSLLCGVVEIIIFFAICGIGIDTYIVSSLIKFLLTLLLAIFCVGCTVVFMIFSAIVGEYVRTKHIKKSLEQNNFTIIDEREEKSKKDL